MATHRTRPTSSKRKPAKKRGKPASSPAPAKSGPTFTGEITYPSSPPSGLLEWHERFCWRYASTLNATRSYMAEQPDAKPNSAATEGWKLLQRPEIKARVAEVQADLRAAAEVDAKDVLRRLLSIATADPNELIEFRRTCCRFCYGIDHRYQHTQSEWDRQPRNKYFDERGGVGYDARKAPNSDCPECFGDGVGEVHVKDTRSLSPEALCLYAGVKVTKDGIEVKMHDQKAALVDIGKHLGMFTEKIDLTVTDGLATRLKAARERAKR